MGMWRVRGLKYLHYLVAKKNILRVMGVNLYLLHHVVDIRSVHSRPEELLIVIYRIKNKGLCLHNMCVLCIFIVYM